MKFAEIKELLDKGFTPEQVMQLNEKADEPMKEEPEKKEEQPKAAQPDLAENDVLKELKTVITDLTHTIQANALLTDSQPKRETSSVDSVLAAIIDPPRKDK